MSTHNLIHPQKISELTKKTLEKIDKPQKNRWLTNYVLTEIIATFGTYMINNYEVLPWVVYNVRTFIEP